MPAWSPQPGPQTEAIVATWCEEMLYGGAAGGGKTDFLQGDFLQDVDTYGDAWRGVLFRRTYPELEEIISRTHEVFPNTGATWHKSEKLWKWPNGANLKLRYLERFEDVTRYQGHQYTWIGWDELTQWSDLRCYNYLKSRLRSASHVPTKRIRATANPGGKGHHAVKKYFIEHAPGGFIPRVDSTTKSRIMFVPSRVQDNKIMMNNDPEYILRLAGAGSPELVKALLKGDWSVIQGAYFPEFSTALHIVDPFPVPEHWLRFRGFDWGSARPFAVVWCAVSDGTIAGINKGAIVVYREWYGAAGPNEGIRLTSEEIAAGILDRESRSENITYSVGDPAIFHRTDGPSIGERMAKAGVLMKRADNDRIAGWDQCRQRLKGEDGEPMLVFFNTCIDSIRTIPALQHDERRPEDVDTDGDDHLADALRYALQSRPYIRPKPDKKTQIKGLNELTFNDLLEMDSRRRLRA